MDEEKPLLTIFILMIIFFVIGIFVLFFTAFIPILFGNNEKELTDNYEQHLEKRTELVKLVETNQLEYEEDGKLNNLSKLGYNDLAYNDEIYVRYEEDKYIVEFVYKPSFPDEGQSIFYSSGGKELLEKIIDKSLYAYIKHIDGNWYFVQYN